MNALSTVSTNTTLCTPVRVIKSATKERQESCADYTIRYYPASSATCLCLYIGCEGSCPSVYARLSFPFVFLRPLYFVVFAPQSFSFSHQPVGKPLRSRDKRTRPYAFQLVVSPSSPDSPFSHLLYPSTQRPQLDSRHQSNDPCILPVKSAGTELSVNAYTKTSILPFFAKPGDPHKASFIPRHGTQRP